MVARLLVVAGIVAALAAAPAWWRARFRRLERATSDDGALIPEALRGPADRTWVVFTTPWCAACGPVETRLRAADPDAHVALVDATEHASLARSFAVRSAPTVLLADREGRVSTRLVGPEAVERYLSAAR